MTSVAFYILYADHFGWTVFSQTRPILKPHRSRMSNSLLETQVSVKCNSVRLE